MDDVNSFIMQAALPGLARDYVMGQTGEVAKSILNTLQKVCIVQPHRTYGFLIPALGFVDSCGQSQKTPSSTTHVLFAS
jgi:hypothetical protein